MEIEPGNELTSRRSNGGCVRRRTMPRLTPARGKKSRMLMSRSFGTQSISLTVGPIISPETRAAPSAVANH
jgi:hypothetical protein